MKQIWLATDLSPQSMNPWLHALRIWYTHPEAHLRVVHVKQHNNDFEMGLPEANVVLKQWGLLEEDSPLDFEAMRFHLQFHELETSRAKATLNDLVALHAPDLVIVGTHRPTTAHRLLEGSVGETLARSAPKAALILPDGVIPFVEPAKGEVALSRILIPAGEPGAQKAIDAAASLAETLGVKEVEFVFVYVGPFSRIPQLTIPDRPGWSTKTVRFEDGAVVSRIAQVATVDQVNLIAMATHGHDSWQDTLFGSRTERVARDSEVPVLVAPIPPSK